MMRKIDLKKFLQRVFTIVVYAPIILAAIYFGDLLLFIAVLTLALISLQEMYNMYNLKFKKTNDDFYYGYVFSVLLLLSVYLQEIRYVWENYLLFALAVLLIGFFVFELFQKKNYFLRNGFFYLLRSILYCGLMWTYLLLLRNLPGEIPVWDFGVLPAGFVYCIYLIGVVWANDIFAYLIGMPLGKHPLAPQISPHKSIEGSLGGLVAAILVSILLRNFLGLTILQSASLGLFLSVFSQIGDLIESLLKRSLSAKDSSHLLPGHGGILDRADSLILTFPVFYYFVLYFVK